MFLLVGDHAGNAIPGRLGDLGLPIAERSRHIAWDIGVRGLGTRLAERLDARFIFQPYSRLVVDCNRARAAPDAIPATSDGTVIPGNAGLAEADKEARFAAIHEPYHQRIGAELARTDPDGLTPLVSLHSFTPRMAGFDRPWHIGVLHDQGNNALALAMLAALRERPDLVVGDNEPYRMDAIDYSVPRHAYPAGRPYVELEIRQDLIETAAGQHHWAELIADCLDRCLPARLYAAD